LKGNDKTGNPKEPKIVAEAAIIIEIMGAATITNKNEYEFDNKKYPPMAIAAKIKLKPM
jgi:hypothetical protein